MRLRTWLLMSGVGLCSGVISACTHTNAGACLRGAPSNERQAVREANRHEPSGTVQTSHTVANSAADQVSAEEKVLPEPTPREKPDILPPPLTARPAPRLPQAPVRVVSQEKVPPARPAEPSAPPDAPLVAALRCFLEGRSSTAFELLSQYPKENQELLLKLLPLIVRLTQVGVTQAGPDELAILADQLESLSAPLRTRAELTIDKLCFVKECRGFGDYEPREYTFGHGEHVRLYAEIGNVSSTEQQANDEKVYLTNLASRLEIRACKDNTLYRIPVEPMNPMIRSFRRDFFVVYEFWLPENLPRGDYVLCLEVRDVSTKRVSKVRRIDFHLAGVSPRARPIAQRTEARDQ